MTKIRQFLFLVFLSGATIASAGKLPSFIKTCYRDDPQVSDCVLREGRRIQKQFIAGIPELGVKTMDPLYIGDMEILTQNLNNLQLRHTNAVLKGFKNAKLVDIKVDFKSHTGMMRLTGNSTLLSDYEIKGQLLLLPIEGRGKSVLKLRDYDITMNWNWNVVQGKDGKNHLKITDFSHKYELGNAYIKLENLFNGDKLLGDMMNKILNENWREILEETGPPYMRIIQKKVVDIFNDFYSRIPYDELVPLSKS